MTHIHISDKLPDTMYYVPSDQILDNHVLFPFAWDDLACRRLGDNIPPVVHIWRHKRAFVVGLRDRKLPHAEKAIRWLAQQGYEVAVRHSGGAAVPLDDGVVNVSLILPKKSGYRDFHEDFQQMAQLIAATVIDQQVDIGEISHSYCPGDYDLSINGRKFCGIAQRRQTKAFIIHAFVNVGTHQDRTQDVRTFYEIASGNNAELHPPVQQSSTSNLQDDTNIASASEWMERFTSVIKQHGVHLQAGHYDVLPTDDVLHWMDKLYARYTKLKEVT
ncbi:lipoate--protein ligase family protein [Longirhabdus pacifica]|uniref:lipoate--protein ligase family protein n=1 Tax=Longirhabdus pacifica TaxID=2305227 RepID=UPI001008FB28|nr:lipoate--protein ligase family protein [Longirhabdus pacifica]